MRSILLILSFLFILSSCSGDDPFTPEKDGNDPDNAFDPVRIGINASAKDVNIFDNVQFSLYPNRDCNLLEVRMSYDSLIWLVPELDGLFKIMRPDGFTFSWSNSFSGEGQYHTILRGFKDSKMILSDTIVVNVKNKRDILGYNWKDIKESQKGLYGTADIFDSRYSISTSKIYENGSPALELHINLNTRGKLTDEIRKEYQEQEQEKVICDYVTKLYGKPKLSHEKNAAAVIYAYKDTFKHGDKTLSPRYIWETSTSRIVLLEIYGIWGEWNSYFALAESII